MADGGEIFADTDSRSGRLSSARIRLMKEFPALSRYDFHLQPGSGKGFAEFYPADEGRNPNPGIPTIEVRRFDLPDKELESIILGDFLHLAPTTDPKIGALKSQFVSSLKPSQLEVLKSMYAERDPDDPRSFSEFVDQVGADAFIRDYFFQKRGAVPGGMPFVSGVGPEMGAFFPDQIQILEQMRSALSK